MYILYLLKSAVCAEYSLGWSVVWATAVIHLPETPRVSGPLSTNG